MEKKQLQIGDVILLKSGSFHVVDKLYHENSPFVDAHTLGSPGDIKRMLLSGFVTGWETVQGVRVFMRLKKKMEAVYDTDYSD